MKSSRIFAEPHKDENNETVPLKSKEKFPRRDKPE